MPRGLFAAACRATADVIPECPDGKRPGCKAIQPPTTAAATVAQADTARFMIAPCRRIYPRPARRDGQEIATWLFSCFPLLATIDVATAVLRQASFVLRAAMAANEAGAQAPTGKIRLGEVVREARGSGSRVDGSLETPRGASRWRGPRSCWRPAAGPESTMTGRRPCTGRLCRKKTCRRKICRKRIWRDGTACHPPSRPSMSLRPPAPCLSWWRHRAATHRSRRSGRSRAPVL
jgi:hypothetical protein